jgi:hypothetical protein
MKKFGVADELARNIKTASGVGKKNKFDNPMNFKGSVDLAQKARALKLSEYLYGAIHPAEAVTMGLDVKLPTDLPIPSACIRVSKLVTLPASTTGLYFINYCPGSLLSSNSGIGLLTTLSVNTNLTSSTPGSNSFLDMGKVDVPQVFDKWRLTAAEMQVKYVGKVLDQSGTMISCCHYEPVGYAKKGSAGAGTISGLSNGTVDRLSGNQGLVAQGLWNTEISISEEARGITHIWTPSSSADFLFPASVGQAGSFSNFYVGVTADSVALAETATSTTVNTQAARSFCWYIANAPIGVTCFQFVVHEVYEFLPDIGSVAVLKLSEDAPTHEEYAHSRDVMTSVAKKASTRKNIDAGGFMSDVTKIVQQVAKHVDLPMLLAKVGSMLI